MSNVHVKLDKEIVDFVYKKEGENIESTVNKIVCFALKEQNILVDDIYISITKASKDEIQKINKEYRNIDSATDVLSFPIFDKEELEKIKNEEDESKKIKSLELGDIIICMDVVEEHSLEYGTGLKREMLYMITHGTAHLLGFDHIISSDKKEMRKFEENILSKVGVGKVDE